MTSLNDLTKAELIKLITDTTRIYEYEIRCIKHERFFNEAQRLRNESIKMSNNVNGLTLKERIAIFKKSNELWEKAEAMQRKADKEYELTDFQTAKLGDEYYQTKESHK